MELDKEISSRLIALMFRLWTSSFFIFRLYIFAVYDPQKYPIHKKLLIQSRDSDNFPSKSQKPPQQHDK